jgi:hypothetical protein
MRRGYASYGATMRCVVSCAPWMRNAYVVVSPMFVVETTRRVASPAMFIIDVVNIVDIQCCRVVMSTIALMFVER